MARARIKGGKKLDAFLRRAKGGKGVKEIEVGFYATAKYQDGTPVTNVAAWNEFGVPKNNIPERPFFRLAVKKMQKPIIELLKERIDPFTMVVTYSTADAMGQIGQREVKASIIRLRQPPNSPITIHGGAFRRGGKVVVVKGKGSDNPLVNLGFMHQSATYRVVP